MLSNFNENLLLEKGNNKNKLYIYIDNVTTITTPGTTILPPVDPHHQKTEDERPRRKNTMLKVKETKSIHNFKERNWKEQYTYTYDFTEIEICFHEK